MEMRQSELDSEDQNKGDGNGGCGSESKNDSRNEIESLVRGKSMSNV